MQGHKVIKTEYNQKHLDSTTQRIVNEWVSLRIHLLLSLMGHLSGRKFTIKIPETTYYMYAQNICIVTINFSFKTNDGYGYYVENANCAAVFDCGSDSAKVVIEKRSHITVYNLHAIRKLVYWYMIWATNYYSKSSSISVLQVSFSRPFKSMRLSIPRKTMIIYVTLTWKTIQM